MQINPADMPAAELPGVGGGGDAELAWEPGLSPAARSTSAAQADGPGLVPELP